MELTQKEQNLIEQIRKLKDENQFNDFYMVLHYEPISLDGGGFVEQVLSVDPANLTSLRSKFYDVANDLKSIYSTEQMLFLFVFDGYTMRLLRH